MRLIIEARTYNGKCDAKRDGNKIVAIADGRDKDISELSLTLAEGRSLLAEVQCPLKSQQRATWLSANTRCRHCGSASGHKGHLAVRCAHGVSVSHLEEPGAVAVYEYRPMWSNPHGFVCYLRKNTAALVNDGSRHPKAQPIANSIAESAANQSVETAHAKEATDALGRRGHKR